MEVNLSIMTKDQLKKFIVELDKENKNLKEINESQNEEIQRFKDNAMADMTEITKLEVENRKLKKDLEFVYGWKDQLEKENKKLKAELEWYKTEHERLVDKLVIKWATELLDRKFENKKWWKWE